MFPITDGMPPRRFPIVSVAIERAGPTVSSAGVILAGTFAESRRWRRRSPFAHEHNVVHRDVSLGNVLIRRSDGAAKLTDLGLACRAGEEAPKYCGEVAGTYGYMAPEVLRGRTVSPLSDLYSLGALAYWLLDGPPER